MNHQECLGLLVSYMYLWYNLPPKSSLITKTSPRQHRTRTLAQEAKYNPALLPPKHSVLTHP